MNKGLIKNSWAHPARVWDASPTVPPTVQDGGSETPNQPPQPQGAHGLAGETDSQSVADEDRVEGQSR